MTAEVWKEKTLGIVGGGNMAEALVKGVLGARLMPPSRIVVNDPLPERLRLFAEMGCRPAETIADAAGAEVVLLSVKPQTIMTVLAGIAQYVRPGTLVVSIAAGVPITSLEEALPLGVGVVRVMPNTPMLIGEGVSAMAGSDATTRDDLDLIIELFSCAGAAYAVDESVLDAVTALSGSGPAYLFRFAEALIDGGVALGLEHRLAHDLAIGTLRGAADMLARDRNPAKLRRLVTSPGGTTEAALGVLEERNFAGVVRDALAAARRRSEELGRGA